MNKGRWKSTAVAVARWKEKWPPLKPVDELERNRRGRMEEEQRGIGIASCNRNRWWWYGQCSEMEQYSRKIDSGNVNLFGKINEFVFFGKFTHFRGWIVLLEEVRTKHPNETNGTFLMLILGVTFFRKWQLYRLIKYTKCSALLFRIKSDKQVYWLKISLHQTYGTLRIIINMEEMRFYRGSIAWKTSNIAVGNAGCKNIFTPSSRMNNSRDLCHDSAIRI